jgi:hypothetical protein
MSTFDHQNFEKWALSVDKELNEVCAENALLKAKIGSLMQEIAMHKSVMKHIHFLHSNPHACARLVDEYWHLMYPEEYNPHKAEKNQ